MRILGKLIWKNSKFKKPMEISTSPNVRTSKFQNKNLKFWNFEQPIQSFKILGFCFETLKSKVSKLYVFFLKLCSKFQNFRFWFQNFIFSNDRKNWSFETLGFKVSNAFFQVLKLWISKFQKKNLKFWNFGWAAQSFKTLGCFSETLLRPLLRVDVLQIEFARPKST